MRLYAPIFLAAMLAGPLAGCGFTEAGDEARVAISNEGAQAYDKGLANSEWFLCQAASVGSIQRRYGRSADLAQAWRTLCLGDAEADILGAPAE